MKLKIILSFLVFAMAMSSAYASFPVKRTVATASEISSENVEFEVEVLTPVAVSEKSQGIALLFWWFLGVFAAHRWYLGSPWYWNVLFIITLGGLGIWAIVDLIGILTGSYEPRNGKYKKSFF